MSHFQCGVIARGVLSIRFDHTKLTYLRLVISSPTMQSVFHRSARSKKSQPLLEPLPQDLAGAIAARFHGLGRRVKNA